MIWLLLSSTEAVAARFDKNISIARRALETQFSKEKTNQNDRDRPTRVSPGGPDPHHH